MIDITLSNKAEAYLGKKNVRDLLIKISFFSETCVQIYEPKIIPISTKDVEDLQNNEKIILNELNFYVSNEFLGTYPNERKIQVDLQRFPKKLIIKNIDPIIINVCKLEE